MKKHPTQYSIFIYIPQSDREKSFFISLPPSLCKKILFFCQYLLTALAFGLSIVAMAYSIGNVSGCHINPAVSIAVFLRQGISAGELFLYIIAQIIGAFAGTGLLHLIFKYGQVVDMTGGYGANGLAGVNGSGVAGLIVPL